MQPEPKKAVPHSERKPSYIHPPSPTKVFKVSSNKRLASKAVDRIKIHINAILILSPLVPTKKKLDTIRVVEKCRKLQIRDSKGSKTNDKQFSSSEVQIPVNGKPFLDVLQLLHEHFNRNKNSFVTVDLSNPCLLGEHPVPESGLVVHTHKVVVAVEDSLNERNNQLEWNGKRDDERQKTQQQALMPGLAIITSTVKVRLRIQFASIEVLDKFSPLGKYMQIIFGPIIYMSTSSETRPTRRCPLCSKNNSFQIPDSFLACGAKSFPELTTRDERLREFLPGSTSP
ncbi:hypothetical protein WN51_12899 [Melipona quadrifasciata]|uniref:Uncharacterized protein n=1 Tax=Melipona quadrifasciata TaxID=166423 RepID=A0A0M9A126_9HYME|nr:hypothetical protein WN51_12899 [Melipona quadrifasciata]